MGWPCFYLCLALGSMNILTVPPYIVVSPSPDKYTYWKSLWIKASAKCPIWNVNLKDAYWQGAFTLKDCIVDCFADFAAFSLNAFNAISKNVVRISFLDLKSFNDLSIKKRRSTCVHLDQSACSWITGLHIQRWFIIWCAEPADVRQGEWRERVAPQQVFLTSFFIGLKRVLH